jgi:TonB family protein
MKKRAKYMSDEAFSELVESFEQAIQHERDERNDLRVTILPAPLQSSSDSLAQASKTSDKETVVRKSEVELEQEAIKKVEPVFPPIAKAAHASGPVKVEVMIDETGRVISAHAVSGHPLLRDSAQAAARQWKFKPKIAKTSIHLERTLIVGRLFSSRIATTKQSLNSVKRYASNLITFSPITSWDWLTSRLVVSAREKLLAKEH